MSALLADLRRWGRGRPALRNLLVLALLGLIWGGSFMFIKVAVRELEPSALVLGRVGSATLVLALAVPLAIGARATAAELREFWPALVLIGLIYTALPLWLLSWGETRIDSGLAAIIQAAVPIFIALLAIAFFHEQRVSREQLLGIGIGFVGVALLVGAQPEGKILGALAVVGMAACYAIGGLLTTRHLAQARPEIVALGTTAVATLAMLPAGLAQAPTEPPHWKTVGSVLMLGVFGTAFAYFLFFALIANAGAAYASLVTYLVPPIALAYGAVFLGERFAASAFGALALILAGVALGSGALRPARVRRRLAALRGVRDPTG